MLTKKTLLEIIKIIATAIISVSTVLLVESCTSNFSLYKHSRCIRETVNQSPSTVIDSTQISIRK